MTTVTAADIEALPNSPRRMLVAHVLHILQTNPTLQSLGVAVVCNPRGPADLAKGPLVLVLKDAPDKFATFQGGQPVRVATFILAAIARLGSATGAQQADDHADRLHNAAAAAIRAGQRVIDQSTSGATRLTGRLFEESTVFQVEGLDVDGALVASTWLIRYQQQQT